LATLKLILAYKKGNFNKGAQVAITDLMTLSNNMFAEAMKAFPKQTLKVKKPNHHTLGDYIRIVGNGVESLHPSEVGKDLSFLDINKALQDGHFGDSPRVWKDNEWSLLINYITQGMDYSNSEWDSLDWTPQIWSTMGETRKRAPPASRAHIEELKKRASQPDEYMRHMKGMPSFNSFDALSTGTASTRQDDGERSAESFSQEAPIWHAALKKHLPKTVAKHEAERNSATKEGGWGEETKGGDHTV
jgi:hypothetical protein